MKAVEEEVMTVKDVAGYLKVKPVTVYKLAENGAIPAFKVASLWRFKKELVESWAREQSRYHLQERLDWVESL